MSHDQIFYSRLWHSALLLLIFSLCSGCAGAGARLWPIYFEETVIDEAGDRAVRREILYPLVETSHSQSRSYVALRPLANFESVPGDGLRRLQFLWPIGLVSLREDRGELYRLWPVFQHSRTVDFFSAEATTHGWIFPVIYWGEKPDQGRYGGILPVGGRTYGILGDEFSWLLFPLYSYYRQGQYQRHNLLWPFLSRGYTPDRRLSTWRAWPVYVRKEEEGAYEHNYLFWPFFRWGHEQWETVRGAPMRRDYFAFHPFYGQQASRDEEENVVAGKRHMLLYNRRFDTRWEPGRTQWSALFSLVRRQDIEKVDEWRFFPLYWRKTRFPSGRDEGGRAVHYRFLWPLMWHTHDSTLPDKHRSYSLLAPVLWHFRTHYVKDDVTEKSTTLWPALTVEHGREDSFGLYVLSHGWRDSAGGYKRNYRPFFEFFRFHMRPDGSMETRLLWRLFHYKSGLQQRHISVPFLFSYDRATSEEEEDGAERTLSFLLGLLQYESNAAGRRLRFLGR